MTRRSLAVARWEFLTTITRRTYVLAVVLLPVLYGALAGGALVINRAALSGAGLGPGGASRPVGIVDRASLGDLAPRASGGPAVTFSSYPDVERALGDLRAGRLAMVYVIEADYLTTGTITAFKFAGTPIAPALQRRVEGQLGDGVRASLLRAAPPGSWRDRLSAPIGGVSTRSVDAEGRTSPVNEATSGVLFFGPFGLLFVLTMAIFLSSGFLQQAASEDRRNRVMEMLLASIDVDDLLIGKILGLGAAGLLQVAIYVVLLIVPAVWLLAVVEVSLARLALAFAYFLSGFLLFASLLTGTAMLSRTPQESSQMSMLWTAAAGSPLFLFPAILTAPNGTAARALSFFPLTGPAAMMLRLAMATPPAIDVAISLAIGATSIYVVISVFAKLARAATLMYGKPATGPELLRWLREA